MILRKRRLAWVALITCMLKPSLPQMGLRWPALQPPPVHLHVGMHVVEEIEVHLELQVANRASRSARRAPSAYGSTSTH